MKKKPLIIATVQQKINLTKLSVLCFFVDWMKNTFGLQKAFLDNTHEPQNIH